MAGKFNFHTVRILWLLLAFPISLRFYVKSLLVTSNFLKLPVSLALNLDLGKFCAIFSMLNCPKLRFEASEPDKIAVFEVLNL